jgi:hypothetical protein
MENRLWERQVTNKNSLFKNLNLTIIQEKVWGESWNKGMKRVKKKR